MRDARRNIRENARRHNELARAGLSASAARLAGYGDLSIDRIQASMDAQIQRAFAASENRQRAVIPSAVAAHSRTTSSPLLKDFPLHVQGTLFAV